MIGFVGCSFTAGYGWSEDSNECKNSPYLWTNIFATDLEESTVNFSQSGASNTDIFEQAMQAISLHRDNLRYLVCQWTSFPRYTFRPGLETWISDVQINPSTVRRLQANIDLSSGTTWSKKYVNDLVDRFLVMHHLHPEILKVVKYVNIIVRLCQVNNITPVFINGLCSWDKDYFVYLNDPQVKPESYTEFTKKFILDIDHKSDEEIYRLYNLIHQEYQSAGGIAPEHWINLYDSWKQCQVDYNHDNNHPGKQSNINQATQLRQYINQLK